MNFHQRKVVSDKISSYLKSENCCIEHLMGLKVVIQALDVAIDRRLQELLRQRDKLNTKLKINNEQDWLD